MRLVGSRYSRLNPTERKPVTVIIDEFANFAMPEFINLMDRARGAGVGIVMAHQSRADLRHISPEFQERIESNANTILVSGVKSSEDADYYAGIIGTRTVSKETVQKVDELFMESATGVKSVREAEEYILHPNKIKSLQQGELLSISTTVDERWGLVRVPKAIEFPKDDDSVASTVSTLKAIRKLYLENRGTSYLLIGGEEAPPPEPSESGPSNWNEQRIPIIT